MNRVHERVQYVQPTESSKPRRRQQADAEQLQQLMCRIVNRRDKQALAELFSVMGARILAFAQKQLGDEQTAKEVLQDTMMAVWQKGHSYDQDKAKVSTWLFTIARNLCYDLGRRKLSRPQLVSADLLYHDQMPEETAAPPQDTTDLEQPLIAESLDRLPVEQRQAIALVYLKECSHQEAADILGLPVGTVKSRVRLGLKKLTDMLKAGGYER